MLSFLGDIASDLSVLHRVDDASELEAAVFFDLALRLPAYAGALAARVRTEIQGDTSAPAARPAQAEQAAPPATAARFSELNAKLGQRWFSHVEVPRA